MAKKFHTFFTDKAATGIGTPMSAADEKYITFIYDVDGSSTATVKFQGSQAATMPDFASAQSAANQWDYIDVVDLQDKASIDGDTGVGVSATTDHRVFQINSERAFTFVNAVITAISGGAVTVRAISDRSE